MQSPMQSLVSLHPAIIVVALLMAAAFCVAGLMIQHEAEKQRRIAERVRDERDERRADRLRQSRRAARLQAYPVPLAGVLDGGAPLAGSVILVDRPMDRPTLRQVTGQSSASTPSTPATAASTPFTPSIPDESPESDADDISTQTTQKLPAAARSARPARRARPVPPPVPPEILEAMGGRWVRTPPWVLPDDARN
ncbi:MAG TPA: hypothetical protein VFU63_01940 [Ktedonobacterales bacterium]|nr:hypothetical protein [Ktedonobacterales bacterium]